jgi:hypothetical protein
MCIVSFKGREEGVRDRVCRVAGEGRGRIKVFYCCLGLVRSAILLIVLGGLSLTPLYLFAYFESVGLGDEAMSGILPFVSLVPIGIEFDMAVDMFWVVAGVSRSANVDSDFLTLMEGPWKFWSLGKRGVDWTD